MANTGENQETKLTSRQRLSERYKGRNPELNVDDDEVLGEAILSDLDAYDQDAEKMRRFNETVSNSRIAPEMMTGLLSGKNPDGSDFDLEDYLLEKHLDYFLDILENRETAKSKADARRKVRQEEAELEAKAAELAKTEDAEFNAAVQESGYKPEQAKELFDWIYGEKDKQNGFIHRGARFELKKPDFLRMFQIKDLDQKIAAAEDKGYRRGRNEKIDMFRRGQQRRDDMPADLEGGGGAPASDEEQDNATVKALKKMKKY